jgi:hypothetical protein
MTFELLLVVNYYPNVIQWAQDSFIFFKKLVGGHFFSSMIFANFVVARRYEGGQSLG